MNYKPLYPTREACVVGCFRSTKMYQLIGAGILDARKAGRRTLITGESLQQYVDSLPKADIRTGREAA